MPEHLDLRQRIANLSVEQRAELERRLLDGPPQDRARAGIPRRGPGAVWPMSFGQQRLWVLHQLEPGLIAYNLPRATRLQGRLNVGALRRSLDALVERHEGLRTTFAAVQGEPVQVVGSPRAVELPIVDLSAMEPAARGAELTRQLLEEARAPFDLARDLMVRGRLVRLAPDEHVLALTLHHIASDGLSGGIFDRELAALYAAFAAGEPSPLPPLPIQYADYAVWHRRWFEGAAEEQMRYWRGRLSGAPAVLDLPADRPRPAVASYRGARHIEELPAELVAATGALGRRLRATPFMVLLAMFKALVARYCRQSDVVVGTAIAGRTRVEMEGLIGFFVNTLVLRTDLAGDPTVAELVERVRQTALGAYGHQEMPFERLVQELKPDRMLDRSPLIQVAFVMQEAARAPLGFPGLVATPLEVSAETAAFDLALSLVPDANGLSVRATYSTDLFERDTIAQMLRHYRTLLEGAVADPARRLSALPLLAADERRRLLAGPDRPAAPAASPDGIHRRFEAQAARTPDAIALVAGEQRLSYAELNRRANRLAHRLRGQGVGPDRLVGVFLEPGADLVVALLAVLKAGGAYLPLDPAYPTDRLAFMLEDARVSALVAACRAGAAPPPCAAPVVAVDGVQLGAEPDTNPVGLADPAHLAYVIYTSGSTGRPKGVMITHANVTRLFEAATPWLSFTDRDVWTLFHSAAFDFSVWEMWGALLHGGRLVVVSPLTARSPSAFLDLLRDEQVTVLNQTPSAFRQLVAEDDARGGSDGLALRAVVFGGEALEPAMLRPWVLRHGACAPSLINMYGITETTVHVTYHHLGEAEVEAAIGSNIGRPLADLQTYVLDAALEPVPVGVPGEIYVGGAGLARGYLYRPDLSAERFIPDPHGDRPGARLYRTGDLARWRRDGSLEYLGRADHQVKIRGYRIELGEIEVALARHPAVREAVVAAQGPAEDRRLIAYLVAAGASRPDLGELRAALQVDLPAHMIPAAFLWVDALPLTPSGKLDRLALERLGGTPAEQAAARVAPRTPLEESIAAIWADVLGVEQVGVRDNFFELGGHSLLAVRVATRLAELVGRQIPLRRLFEAPTVAELAEGLRATPRGDVELMRPPLRSVDRGGPLPLSYSQEQFWLINQEDPTDTVYNNSYLMRLRGRLNVPALQRALDALVARHEAFRANVAVVGGEPRQLIREPRPVPVELVDLGALPEADRRDALDRRIESSVRRVFDLGADLLIRGILVRLDEDDHVLGLTLHHFVTDAAFEGLLWSELSALYGAFAEGRPSPLPPLAVQYADYASWQRQWLVGEILDAAVDHWKRRLAGAPPALDLPTDRPRQPGRRSPLGRANRVLPKPLSDGVKALGRRHGASMFMTLLAAFAAVLHRYTGAEDIVIGAPSMTRDLSEFEGGVGCFLNILALRVDLSGDPAFGELLGRVRQMALEDYDYRHAPFQKVVAAVNPVREAGRTPLFQVMCNMHVFGEPAVDFPGLHAEPHPRPGTNAMFDLSLFHYQGPDGAIRLAMQYAADLFDPDTIERLLEHCARLLEGAVADPACPLSALPLLSAREREQLGTWSQPSTSGRETDACLHRLVERQVALTPDAPAVVAPDGSLTYAELDARANQLARHLRGLGVGPEGVVAISMERSLDLVVGLLGILKAGGAYLPLDPGDPRDRLALTIEDSRTPVLLTQSRLVGALPAEGMRVVCVDADRERIAAHPATALPDGPTADAIAYVMFTSGSTGRPKGVAIEHRAIVNHMRWMQRAFPLTAADAVLQKTPASFDASVWEYWAPLLQGARLVLAAPGVLQEPRRLVQQLAEQGVTILQVVPPLLRVLLDEPEFAACGALRRVFSGGEALPADLVRRFHGTVGAELVNLYGPTEVTIDSTFWPCQPGRELGAVPIGRPIDNVAAWVLDRTQGLAPIGIPGELHLGGAGLARGYLNRPELTAERFLPDSHGSRMGGRLYRTGDLARWRADGSLEYLGRADQQVKVRGYRIELGEVESALARADEIKEAAVLAREEGGDRRLVAYLVPAGTGRPGGAALREALKRALPEYMIPATFVWVDALPLTSSGKVDRRALGRLSGTRAERGSEHVAPRTPLEETVAAIWAEVLGEPSIGVHDNFFELGGHSLLAVRVAARLGEAVGGTVPLRRLIESPTVAELAEAIAGEESPPPPPPAWPVPGDGRPAAGPGGSLPLSHFQEQFWLINQEDPGDPAYNLPHAVRLRGRLVVPALRDALTQLVDRHEVLRTVFALVDGEPRQTVNPPEAFDLPVVDLAAHSDAEEQCRRLIAEEATRPFDLSRDRMLRARLLRLGDRDHLLVLVMHHIASDAWSTPILFSEISALYEAARSGRPTVLPPLPLQYAEFAAWQRQHLQGAALAAQIEYWTRRLAGAPAALDLLTDHPRRPRRSPGRQSLRLLPASLAAHLRSLGARAGATPFMTLLAAFAALLHRYTGAEDIVIGAPVQVRDRTDVRPLIGCFVNMIALRVELSGDPPFADLLARVRAGALEAYDHKDAPFPRVVEALRPARMAGRTPVFQVVLNMHDFGQTGLRLADLESERVPRQDVGAMFDLMLFHQDAPDGGIRLAMEYATDLFDAATVERMLGHLQTLLEGAVADPERRLSRLPLLTEPERRARAAWNATARPGAGEAGLHALFEAQADVRPDAPAAIHAGRELSYGEIEERANRLAHHLRALGAGPDVPVGLCVQRSLDMVVAVLGILKSGAGYVPLDPTYPSERLTYMMATVGMPIVVSHRATTSGLPAPSSESAPRVVCLDGDADAIARQPTGRPRGGAFPQSLLYVLFTSGSSGRAKGVAMSHGPLVNLMRWQHERSGCGVGARTLQFAPYGFDVSCQELFATLGAGGTLVIVDDDTRLDPAALLDVLDRERVERVFMPFVALEQLAQVAVARDAVPQALREVVTAGEQLRITPALAEMFRRRPGARLDNQYGPTECHVVSAHMMDGPPEHWPALPPIGRPVANTTLHVLGRGGEPVPVGVAGELWVGGAALARGYVGRPDLTAERFVASHVDDAPGALLYRTGDLARWSADGRLEYLGRVDQQLKVRGYRVEPGEIEAALEQGVEAVAEAVVVPRPDLAGGQRLVAYLRPVGGSRPDGRVLRSVLRASLPEYMVPSAFEWLDAWPLTASGKVDRRALAGRAAATETGVDEGSGRHVIAHSPLEVSLIAIWEELLGARPIGVQDDFFERGGHSLLAVRMLSAVEQMCGRRVPVAALFAGANIRHLADVIVTEATNFYRTPVTRIQEGTGPPLFFLHGDYYGGGFYSIALARALGPDQTFCALHPHGLDGEPVPATIEAMADAHLATVRRLQPTGPYYLGGYCNAGLIAFEMARRLRAMGEPVAFLALLDASAMNSRLRIAIRHLTGAASALARNGRYYAWRARRVGRGGPAEWAAFGRRKIVASRRFLRGQPGAGPMPADGSAEAANLDHASRRVLLDAAYRRAIMSYVPGRYDGRITVFKAAGSQAGRDDLGWGLVGGDVEAHEIPGEHLTFITLHVSTLAERMRACLRMARGE